MSLIDMAARMAAIRTEIAENGHHPGPDSLTNQDLLALCDEMDRLRALVRRFYTQAWEDPLTDDEERLLDSIVQDADT